MRRTSHTSPTDPEPGAPRGASGARRPSGTFYARTGRFLLFLALAGAHALTAGAAETVRLDGYLDYRKPRFLIIDGQRVRTRSSTRFEGSGKAKSLATIPLGYQIRGSGTRSADGTVVADEMRAEPNGHQMLEEEVLKSTAQAEQSWYGDSGKVANFFFGNHSTSVRRAEALQREIANNYRDPDRDPRTHPPLRQGAPAGAPEPPASPWTPPAGAPNLVE